MPESFILGRANDNGAQKEPPRILPLSAPGGGDKRFIAGEDYLTIRALKFFAPKRGFFAGNTHPILQMRLSHPGAGIDRVEYRTIVAFDFINQCAGSRFQRVYQVDLQALGPIPFRSDLRLEFALFAAKPDEATAGPVSLLLELAEQAALPYAEKAAPFADLLGRGLDMAFGFKDGRSLELGLSKGLDEATEEGVFALVYDQQDKWRPENFQISLSDYELQTSKGRRVNDAPYVVFELQRSQERHGWDQIPDLAEAWREVRAIGGSEGERDAFLEAIRRFRRLAMTSPDLTADDAARISQSASKIAERMSGLFESLDARAADPGPLEAALRPLLEKAPRRPVDVASPLQPEQGVLESVPVDGAAGAPRTPGLPRAFRRAMEFVRSFESEHLDRPDALGGPTKFGVTQTDYSAFLRRNGHADASVQDVKRREAEEILYREYWLKARCDKLPGRLQLPVFDAAINHGVDRSIRLLQLVVETPVDGAMGPMTLAAIAGRTDDPIETEESVRKLLLRRRDFYRQIVQRDPSQKPFLRGWMHRLHALHIEMFGGHAPAGAYDNAGGAAAIDHEAVRAAPITAALEASTALEEQENARLELEQKGRDAARAPENDSASPSYIERLDGTLVLLSALEEAKRPGADNEAQIAQASKAIEDELRALRSARDFQGLHLLASHVKHLPSELGTIARIQEVQALIELKFFEDALALATGLIDANQPHQPGYDESTLIEATGLTGRIFKQQFVDALAAEAALPPAAKQEFLERAYAAYADIFERFDSFWGGGNAVACLQLADRNGLLLRPDVDRRALAQRLIAVTEQAIEKAEGENDKAWAYASKAEGHVALGEWAEADGALSDYIRARKSGFNLAGTIRQFEEVWGYGAANAPEEGRRLLSVLKAAQARTLAGEMVFSETDLSRLSAESPSAGASSDVLQSVTDALGNQKTARTRISPLEKAFGFPIPTYDWVEKLIRIGDAVARIESVRRRFVGTGFLIAGETLSARWAGERLLVTNAHVVSPNGYGELTPRGARVIFERALSDERKFRFAEALWTSPPSQHDVSILRLAEEPPMSITALRFDDEELPEELSEPTAFGDRVEEINAEVTVIGHPQGRQLSLSTKNLRLRGHDGPTDLNGRPVRIRYQAPTEPGNSGSPVFDWLDLRLIGVHHAGGEFEPLSAPTRPSRRRIFGDLAPTELANQAISLGSIRQAIAVHPDGWPLI